MFVQNAQNILLDDRGNIRLTDFGLSHKLNGTDLVHSFSGTAIYLVLQMITLSASVFVPFYLTVSTPGPRGSA